MAFNKLSEISSHLNHSILLALFLTQEWKMGLLLLFTFLPHRHLGMCWIQSKDLNWYSYYQFLNGSGNDTTLDQLLALITTALPLRSTGLHDMILWHWIACFLYNSLFTTIYIALLEECSSFWSNSSEKIGRLLSGSGLNLILDQHNK